MVGWAFLATIQKENVNQSIRNILEGNYSFSERCLLTISTDPPNKALENLDFALNEIAVNRKNTTSMIKVDTEVNGEILN